MSIQKVIEIYSLEEKEPYKGQHVLVDGFRQEELIDGLGDYNRRVIGECVYYGNGQFIMGINVDVKVEKWTPTNLIFNED